MLVHAFPLFCHSPRKAFANMFNSQRSSVTQCPAPFEVVLPEVWFGHGWS